MGDPNRSGEFIDNIEKVLDKESEMGSWDWVEKALDSNHANVVLRQTVRSLCQIISDQQSRIESIEAYTSSKYK